MTSARAPKVPPAPRAEELAREGRVDAALFAVQREIERDPDNPALHALAADLFLAGDFYDEAIARATEAIELDPSCAPAYLCLGLAYDRHGGMWDQSVLVWDELAEVVPDLTTAHVQLGEALGASSFEEQAIDAWQRALEIDAGESRAMYNLAMAALRKEGMTAALPGFRKAGELDPSEEDYFFGLAGIEDDGEPAPDPGDVPAERDARLHAAAALAFEEDYFAASELIRLMLDEHSEDAEALGLAAYLYLKQEAINEAMALSLKALAVDPKTPTAVFVLGSAFTKRPGLDRNAARVFDALAKAVPDHPMSHVLLAEALLGMQRYSRAERVYRSALALDPACVRARFGLAAALLTAGRAAEAQWEIRRAAYYDTERRGLFWRLYDQYAADVEGTT